jgi:hypothetical protein
MKWYQRHESVLQYSTASLQACNEHFMALQRQLHGPMPSLHWLCVQLGKTSAHVPIEEVMKLLMLTVAGDQTLWLHT